MASNPVLHESTQSEITWRVIRRLDLPEPGCVTFQKRGKHRQQFSQLYRWDTEQGEWAKAYGRPTSPRVPKYLIAKIEAALKAEFAAKPEPVHAPQPVPGALRCACPFRCVTPSARRLRRKPALARASGDPSQAQQKRSATAA